MSNKNQGRQDNGGMQGSSPSEMGQKLQERAAQVGDRVREGYDSAREGVAQGYKQAGYAVAHNPGTSVLAAFGVGFGLGVVLTLLLRPEQESWYDRYMPDGLRNVPDRLRHLHMPEAIARHMPGH